VGASVGGTPTPDPVWREIHLGRWEGQKRSEIARLFPEENAALARGEDIPLGGGERWSELGTRIGAGFDALVEATGPDEHVLVVVHGGVIITLIAQLLGVFAVRPRLIGKLSNTSLSRIGIHAGRMVVESYNDAAHIDEQASWHTERDDRGRSVVALRARADAIETLDPSFHDGHVDTAAFTEISVRPRELADWANARLPGTARATMGVPDEGGRCLSVASRSDGTIWSWNEWGL
jgi:broad specificity phosphatase PhoE